jgi:fibronectin type 3 domain-containing protein
MPYGQVTLMPSITKAIIVGLLFAIATQFAIAQSALPKPSESWQVNLTWDAPVSSPDPVSGYNAYRSNDQGNSYVQLNSAIIKSTTYNDLTVSAGSTYDFIVKSVDANGITSTPSNIAVVSIPGSVLATGTLSGVTS